ALKAGCLPPAGLAGAPPPVRADAGRTAGSLRAMPHNWFDHERALPERGQLPAWADAPEPGYDCTQGNVTITLWCPTVHIHDRGPCPRSMIAACGATGPESGPLPPQTAIMTRSVEAATIVPAPSPLPDPHVATRCDGRTHHVIVMWPWVAPWIGGTRAGKVRARTLIILS